MIDTRHGYAIARKDADGRYMVLTDHRPRSTRILLNAYLSPIQERRRELEAEGASGLLVVRIVDQLIIEVADEPAAAQ